MYPITSIRSKIAQSVNDRTGQTRFPNQLLGGFPYGELTQRWPHSDLHGLTNEKMTGDGTPHVDFAQGDGEKTQIIKISSCMTANVCF